MTLPLSNPSPARVRLPAIDVLRGVAILGILLMNIQSFAMPFSAYGYPWSWGDMTGLNAVVYYVCHVIASGKFISIFALLFGAGIILQTSKPDAADSAIAIHFRRMFVLLAFGLAHAYLLWHGDILFTYALLGLLVFLFRGLSPRALAWSAAGFFVGGIALNLCMGLLMYVLNPMADGEITGALNPSMEEQMAEVEAFQGGWLAQMSERLPVAILSQTYGLVTYSLPLVSAFMLGGMALMKAGFFHFTWKRSTYLIIALVGIAAGWSLSASGLMIDKATGRDPILSVTVWSQINVLAMVPTALGYSAAVLLLANVVRGPWLAPLAAVGRTALSCYLLQTILCTTLFYGHGLGWFGSVERAGQVLVVLGVWVVLILFAVTWTRFFRFGPFEWLWRGLTYGFSRV